MPNSTKAIIAIVSVIILSSGIFVLTKSRPVENPAVTVSSSSVAVQVSSSSKSVLSSSSQVVSSSSQSEIIKDPKVENPKVEVPNVETPQPRPLPIVETPKTKLTNQGSCEGLGNVNFYEYVIKTNIDCFKYANLANQVGKNPLSQTDYDFLRKNVNDIAIYYHDSIRSTYPTDKHYVKSLVIQKLDDNTFVINFSSSFGVLQEGATEARNIKNYKLIPINNEDGEFEEIFNFKFSNELPVAITIDSKAPNTANFGHD